MSEYLLVIVLGLIALGAVAFPLLAGLERYPDEAELDADVARYRDALRAGTLCQRCHAPNSPGSRFCGDCGEPLGS